MQPPNAGAPESSSPPYPVVFSEQRERNEAAALALSRLAPAIAPGDQMRTHFQPITATIKSLPTNLSRPLYLPQMGVKPEMTEEEIRESLRRFINDWRNLIGANPSQLSLVERTDRPDRAKIARYEQRPFRYPLRGDYGKLEIHFTADRRLLNVSSSCIPDAERLQNALAAITPQVTREDAVKRVIGESINYRDSLGNQQIYRVSSNNLKPVELVTYARASTGQIDTLELLIAWEINIPNAPFKYVYVDAVTNEIIAVR